MQFLNYSNTAPPLSLSAGVNAAATTLPVASTSGYPDAPFLLGMERGTANEEVVLCTAKSATTFTVTRGYDGTSAKSHGTGTLVEHTVSALVFRGAGIVRLDSATRNALTGHNLWAGRTIWNTTSEQLETFSGAAWLPTSGEDSEVFASEGTLSIKQGKGRFPWPFPVQILGISAVVDTPPAGAAVIVDVNRATVANLATKTSIFTTQANRPTVAIGQRASAEQVPNTTDFAKGDHMTIDIDQVGSTTPGADLVVSVRYRRI